MDSRERFSRAADAYRSHRPSYPPELVDWIEAATGVAPPAPVADIGCGTGIATRMLAARGFAVTGIEPNAAMRAHAIEAGGARYLAGEAAATGLPDASVELVVAAQAFHYFELAPTLTEWRRVLAPSGACAVFWYRVRESEVRDAFLELRQRYSDPARAGGRATPKRLIAETLRRQPGIAGVTVATFRSEQLLDREGLLGRIAASSHLGADPGAPLLRDVEEMFARHQQQGLVRLPLETVAVAWRFDSAG